MRMAIASSDGVSVDEKFELTDTFFIYDMIGERKIFIEKRTAKRYSCTTENIRFKRNRFMYIYETIKDCSAVITTSVSAVVEEKLEFYGIQTKTVEGKISQIKI